MPLFDSLSSGAVQVIRLAKMTSIPTTDDLRYALEEAKKKKSLSSCRLSTRTLARVSRSECNWV